MQPEDWRACLSLIATSRHMDFVPEDPSRPTMDLSWVKNKPLWHWAQKSLGDLQGQHCLDYLTETNRCSSRPQRVYVLVALCGKSALEDSGVRRDWAGCVEQMFRGCFYWRDQTSEKSIEGSSWKNWIKSTSGQEKSRCTFPEARWTWLIRGMEHAGPYHAGPCCSVI